LGLADPTTKPYHETFHFVLNNKVAKDNRIPTYGMSYEEARKRNALPVPADQYGNPLPTGVYNYWDEVTLSPPGGAVYATIDLLYQPTSWEYIQFLWNANDGTNAFLSEEGVNLLAAWLSTGMAEPYVMASTTWGDAPTPSIPEMYVSDLTTWSVGKRGVFDATSEIFKSGDTVGIKSVVVEMLDDQSIKPLSGAQVFMDIQDESGTTVTSIQGFTDANGVAELTWKTSRREAAGTYEAVVTEIIKSGYVYNSGIGVTSVIFDVQ
jgi:MG2 domain